MSDLEVAQGNNGTRLSHHLIIIMYSLHLQVKTSISDAFCFQPQRHWIKFEAVKKKERVSQQSIAHDLGVSQALVSMLLNGMRQNISADSYRRIWDHALKIGYRPKGMQLNGNGTLVTNVGFILRS